jgi:tRNA(Ile)-lysidine synthetase-like protein
MLSEVQAALAKTLVPGEALLVGVSGGADSVALLSVLVELGWQPHVCHLNHQLRGADSDADAEFVRQLATRYGLPSSIEACTVAPDEDSARRARQEFFGRVTERTGLKKLALAHTADDQVETFLLRLLRGAGVPGLVGIWPERQLGTLRVIRPLLKVRRVEIVEYLTAKKLSYREDKSNADTRSHSARAAAVTGAGVQPVDPRRPAQHGRDFTGRGFLSAASRRAAILHGGLPERCGECEDLGELPDCHPAARLAVLARGRLRERAEFHL